MKATGYIRKKAAKKSTLKRVRPAGTTRAMLRSRNFSDIEDSVRAFQVIAELATRAGNNAAMEAKAAGLSRAYIRDNHSLVTVSSQGEEVALTPKTMRSSFYIKFKPHTIFHAVKK